MALQLQSACDGALTEIISEEERREKGGKKLHSRTVVWCRIESAGRDFGLVQSRSAKFFLFSAQLRQ